MVLRWNGVSGAAEYEYEVKYDGGAVIASGSGTDTSFRFVFNSSYRAKKIVWRARAKGNGTASEWSPARALFFSDPIGEIFKCEESACPRPGAYYQVTSEVENGASPPRLVLQWVTYECLNGRQFSVSSYSYITDYARSASRNGCP